jgi:hypothetical protein
MIDHHGKVTDGVEKNNSFGVKGVSFEFINSHIFRLKSETS